MGMLERSLRKYSDDKLHEIINENPDNFGDRVLVLARQELASRQDQEMENRHNGVKTYKIFANPQGQQDAVKQGWSWPGYFFNFFWALKKKMWGLGIGLFILFSVLWGIEGAIEDLLRKGVWETGAITNFLYLLNAIIFGAKGNKWREKKLITRGFDYKDTVNADNPESAIALWLKENKEA